MTRFLIPALLLASSLAHAAGPFAPNTVLSASALNAALAAPTITGGTIDNAPIGATTPSTGKFTTVNGNTITPSTGTLTLAAHKTLAVNSNLAVSGADGASLVFQGSDTYIGRATSDTLTNKTISGATNTLTAIPNSSLAHSSITIAGHAVSLGGTQALSASDLNNGTMGTGAIVLASSLATLDLGSPPPIGDVSPNGGVFSTLIAWDRLISNGAGNKSTNFEGGDPYTFAANTTGEYNVVVGASAMAVNTSGSHDTAIGYNALVANTSGGYNTAVGSDSMGYNTTGVNNSAFGIYALSRNTTGNYNTATGENALVSNTTGTYNFAGGSNALGSNTSSSGGVAVGAVAGYSNSGANNTFVGYGAGEYSGNSAYSHTSGASCVYLGHNASPATSTPLTNAVAIGDSAKVNSSNFMVLGASLNVGIGASTDDGSGNKLQVTGNIGATGTGAMPVYSASGSPVAAPHMVTGGCTLSAGACTVNLSGAAVYSSSSSFVCTASDTGTVAVAASVANQSGTQFIVHGTSTDIISYLCMGN